MYTCSLKSKMTNNKLQLNESKTEFVLFKKYSDLDIKS